MSLYHSCEACGKSVEFGYEKYHDCEYGTKDKREIAALKAEVETLRKEVGSKSAWATQMQKDLQQERERSEKLANILRSLRSMTSENNWHRKAIDEALLAAKRDEGS